MGIGSWGTLREGTGWVLASCLLLQHMGAIMCRNLWELRTQLLLRLPTPSPEWGPELKGWRS